MTKRTHCGRWLALILVGFLGAAVAVALANRVVNKTAGGGGGGGPTLIVADASAAGGAGGTTSGDIDTTAANFLVALVSSYVAGGTGYTFSDSKGNTWTAVALGTSTDLITRLFYCHAPTVGSGHNFSVSGSNTYASIVLYAFSGVASSPYDLSVNASNNSSFTSIATGSATPSQANTLWITGGSVGGTTGTGESANSGFSTATVASDVPGTRIPGFLAWKSVSSTAAVNVTWTIGETASQGTVFLAAFKY